MDTNKPLISDPSRLKKILAILSAIFLVLYVAVLLGAFVASGDELLKEYLGRTVYAAIAPLLIATYWLATGLGLSGSRARATGIVLMVAALPAVWYSFLGLGFLLPLLALIWIRLLLVVPR